jgi:hypothetical protein
MEGFVRKNRSLLIIILLGSIILLSSYTELQAVESDTTNVIINTNSIPVSQSDIERVKKEVEHALNSICPILGIKKQTIRVNITDKGICYTSGGIVYLPIYHIKNKQAAIVHEVTHILAPHFDNKLFSEGLAIYFQERFGEDHGFPNISGVPLDDLVRINQSKLQNIYDLSYDSSIWSQIGNDKREIAYIQAGSFIAFLVKTYGENKLAELHNSWTLNYKKIYGKDIKGLDIEWKKFVFEKGESNL